MEVLQSSDLFLRMIAFITDRDAIGFAGGQCGCVAHFVLQRESPNDGGVADGLMAFRRIDDEIDLFIFQQVRNVRPTLPHFVDHRAFDTCTLQDFCGAVGGDERKAQLNQFSAEVN